MSKVKSVKPVKHATEQVPAVVPAVVQAAVPTETVAQQIWKDIKDVQVDMFALPSQLVVNCCTPVEIEPTKCYLIHKTSAFLPALEASIGRKYNCDLVDKFVVVSKK